MPFADLSVWAPLLLASTCTMGLWLEAVASVRTQARRAGEEQELIAEAEAALAMPGGRDSSRSLGDRLNTFNSPMTQFYAWLIDTNEFADAELKAEALVQEADGGRLRVARLLTRISPLLGLAGTVVGVQQSLGEGQEAILSGFALALSTTLYGIAVSVAAYLVSTFVLEPRAVRIQQRIMDALLCQRHAKARQSGLGCSIARVVVPEDSEWPGNPKLQPSGARVSVPAEYRGGRGRAGHFQ